MKELGICKLPSLLNAESVTKTKEDFCDCDDSERDNRRLKTEVLKNLFRWL